MIITITNVHIIENASVIERKKDIEPMIIPSYGHKILFPPTFHLNVLVYQIVTQE